MKTIDMFVIKDYFDHFQTRRYSAWVLLVILSSPKRKKFSICNYCKMSKNFKLNRIYIKIGIQSFEITVDTVLCYRHGYKRISQQVPIYIFMRKIDQSAQPWQSRNNYAQSCQCSFITSNGKKNQNESPRDSEVDSISQINQPTVLMM